METLYQLMLQLTSTSMSILSSAASDSLVSLTAACIFIHADAVIHLKAEGAITSNLLLGQQHKLRAFVGALHGRTVTFDVGMQFVHSAPFAQARASILAYIKRNCYAPSLHGDDKVRDCLASPHNFCNTFTRHRKMCYFLSMISTSIEVQMNSTRRCCLARAL